MRMEPDIEEGFRQTYEELRKRAGNYQGVIFGMGCRLFDHPNILAPAECLDSYEMISAGYWNDHVYVGEKDGKRILYSIALRGSAAFSDYCEWFLCHGPAEVGIGVGFAGSVIDELKPGDLIVPNAAVVFEGTSEKYGFQKGQVIFNDDDIGRHLKERMYREMKQSRPETSVLTTDAFCAEDMDFLEMVRKAGASVVDQETSTLFSLSRYHGKKAAAILTVSDNVRGHNPHHIRFPPVAHENLLKATIMATEALLDCI